VVLTSADGRVIGGAQVIYRRLSALGAVGYVPKGPILDPEYGHLASLLVEELTSLAKDLRIRHLTIQPADADAVDSEMSRRNLVETSTEVAPRATILLDVARTPDEILAQMHAKTRYNVRLGARKGIVVRDGDERDIPTYHALVVATADRQGFTPFPEQYFRAMWEAFIPSGGMKIAIAEFEDEPVAAQIAIPFNGTVVNHLSVWSGAHGNRRPNEAVQWATISWANQAGHRWYDLGGLKLSYALALRQGEELPASFRQSVASYKLGFGGEIIVFPPARELIPNPVARWGYVKVLPYVERTIGIKRLVTRFRTGR
jgi:lipid II:glycine glycyltransferase (peptidoglycan interpeptide bridge formation enzyme)